MKRKFISFLVAVLVCSSLGGCATNGETNENSEGANGENNSQMTDGDFLETDEEMFTERDYKCSYDENSAVTITLNGDSATASSGSVKISGTTITLTEEATYVISGELYDGMLIVDAKDDAKLQLVFKEVSITSETSAALYILEADKVFLTLAEGTSNSLANGGSFVAVDDNNIDASLFSKQDLTMNGTGSLTVTSPVGHGVVCKDDLVITEGTYEVNSASHGLDANDSVRIANATLVIDAGKDAIHCENNDDTSKGFVYISSGTIKAEAEGDGISAGAYMQIVGGSVDLLAGGGSENGTKEHSDNFGGFMGGGRPGGMRSEDAQSTTTDEEESTSMKGLKSTGSMMISAGDIVINSADDAIHSDVSVIINGGIFAIASGDDAIHAEETLTITAGEINISESYEGLEALDIGVQGGNITLKASDDGLNAAGGTDQSGTQGGRDGMFGAGRPGGMGGHGGMSSNSNGSIKISGGTLYINASGDGIDSNGMIEISGGHTTVVGPTQGDTATLDYDTTATITGGVFIGTGASGMAQTFSDSDQGVIAISVGNQTAGTQITVNDSNGNTIISYEPELNFAVVIISSPEIIKGETYSVMVGTMSGDVEAN